MKKLIFILSAMLILTSLVACDKDKSDKEKVVNLYTDNHTTADQDLYDKFQEETGITVKVTIKDSSALIKKLEKDGKDSDGDLLMVSNVTTLYEAETADLLKAYESKTIDKQVASNFRQEDKSWIALTSSPRAIAYNRFRFDTSTLSTYETLSNVELSNKLILGYASDINNQSLVASMLNLQGEDVANETLEGLVNNLVYDPKANDLELMEAVVSGVADITIVNTNYLGQLLNSTDQYKRNIGGEVGFFFPNQETSGTHLTISGAGLVKSAPHTKNAIKLLEFLTSEEAQTSYTENQYEYPVNPKVQPSELLQSWGEFKTQDIDINTLGELNADAVKLMEAAGWK